MGETAVELMGVDETDAEDGIDQFNDILVEEEDLDYAPAPELSRLSDEDRASVVEHLEPYEESRRAAKGRGATTLYQ